MHAIILAGGRGTRLAPSTDMLPKSLIPMGGLPIVEIVLRQLRAAGYRRATLCVSYLGQMIVEGIGDGGRLGIAVDYCWDTGPLGTAAPLRLVRDWSTPALVMNGDILTALDFGVLARAHSPAEDAMTIAVRSHHVPIEFGVVEVRRDRVSAIREKPSIKVDVSAGIQIVDAAVRRCIPAGRPMDMPELVAALLRQGAPVRVHRFTDPWHDIGTPERLRAAAAAFDTDSGRYLPAGDGMVLDLVRPQT